MTLSLTIAAVKPESIKSGMVAFLAKDKGTLLESGNIFDKSQDGLLHAAVKNSTFSGEKKTILTVATPLLATSHVLVCGLGKVKELTTSVWRQIGLNLYQQANATSPSKLTIVLDSGSQEDHTAVIEGLYMAAYTFNAFKTKEKDKKASLFNIDTNTSFGRDEKSIAKNRSVDGRSISRT